MVVVRKRLIGAKGFFQLGEWKSGIRRNEGPRGVHRFEHYFTAAAAAHPVAERAEQIVGLSGFAGLDPDDLVVTGQLVELARLRKIPVNEFQILGFFEFLVRVRSLIPVDDHVARQRGKNFVGLNVGGDGRHARKRPHGSGNHNAFAPLNASRGAFRKAQVPPAECSVSGEIRLCRSPVARNQVEQHRSSGGARGILRAAGVFPRFGAFSPRLAGPRIPISFQNLREAGQEFRVVGSSTKGTGIDFPGSRGIP
jgi:hypothetical protein